MIVHSSATPSTAVDCSGGSCNPEKFSVARWLVKKIPDLIDNIRAIPQSRLWRRVVRWLTRRAPGTQEVLGERLDVLAEHTWKLEELRANLLREITAREANIGKWRNTLVELASDSRRDISRYHTMTEDLERILESRRRLLQELETKLQELECGKQDLGTQRRLTELYQETIGVGGSGEGKFIDNQTKELLAASDAIAATCDELFLQEKTAMLHLDRPVEEVAEQIADGLETGEKSRRRGLALIS